MKSRNDVASPSGLAPPQPTTPKIASETRKPEPRDTDRTAELDSNRALSVRSLAFRYPGQPRPVLEGISFHVAAGQAIGILGPNGSGKSTLLSALIGTRAGERQVDVAYCGASAIPSTAVGYATQETALYRQLSVRENLRHMARLTMPGRRVDSMVAHRVEEFGLGDVLDRRIHQLSGGWQRLVHLAASFVHDPHLRLLDEPTNALDFETRRRLVELVAAWRRRGDVCLITSHYPEDIEEMCTQVLVIRDGRPVRSAALADLLESGGRELVMHSRGPSGDRVIRTPAPAEVRDLPDATRWLTTGHPELSEELVDLRLSSGSLRDLLTRDPQLREVINDPPHS